MRITHRMIADTVNFNLQQGLRRLELYSNQLSTGKVFQRPSENPVGVGRVMTYNTAIARNEQFRLNMNQSRGWLENTESALQNGIDVLQRIRELCIYGANESLTAEDRRAIAPEVLEFIEHLVGIANTEVSGRYIFGGHQTLEAPFKKENAYHMVQGGGGIAPESEPAAAGFQNGSYRLEQAVSLPPAEIASLEGEKYLQGQASSIFGLDPDQWAGGVSVQSAVSASLLLEVTSVDAENGTVDYSLKAHQYTLEGDYSMVEESFRLHFGAGAASVQSINTGESGLQISLEGLDLLSKSAASTLTAGDRAVLKIAPEMDPAADYQALTLHGSHRGGESRTDYFFNEGTLNGRTIELKSFSLDSFYRSPNRGKVHEGALTAAYETFTAAEAALSFSYDNLGFPVYYGDNHDRIQEISPHQELIMNLSGDKAFGEQQEVFEAIHTVYWALMNNDRDTLGGAALEKMDHSVDHLLEKLSQVGARSNRLEAMYSTLFSENLYLREVRSHVEDIDLAEVITEFTMQENAYRAALATASMMIQPSLVEYWR